MKLSILTLPLVAAVVTANDHSALRGLMPHCYEKGEKCTDSEQCCHIFICRHLDSATEKVCARCSPKNRHCHVHEDCCVNLKCMPMAHGLGHCRPCMGEGDRCGDDENCCKKPGLVCEIKTGASRGKCVVKK